LVEVCDVSEGFEAGECIGNTSTDRIDEVGRMRKPEGERGLGIQETLNQVTVSRAR
jgi:hypothetical protein